MSDIRETCGCGAVWEGDSAYKDERDKFREAHAPCRSNETVEHLRRKLAEALDGKDAVATLQRSRADRLEAEVETLRDQLAEAKARAVESGPAKD